MNLLSYFLRKKHLSFVYWPCSCHLFLILNAIWSNHDLYLNWKIGICDQWSPRHRLSFVTLHPHKFQQIRSRDEVCHFDFFMCTPGYSSLDNFLRIVSKNCSFFWNSHLWLKTKWFLSPTEHLNVQSLMVNWRYFRNRSEATWFQMKTFVSGQEDIVKEKIRNNPDIVNERVNGDLPIHWAVKYSASWFLLVQRTLLNYFFFQNLFYSCR